MSSGNQDQFLRRVRQALGHPPDRKRSPADLILGKGADEALRIIENIRSRTRESRLELLDRLIERAKPLNLQVVPVKEAKDVSLAIAGLVRQKNPEWGTQKSVAAWNHPLINSLNLTQALADQNVPVFVTDMETADSTSEGPASQLTESRREQIRSQVINSYIGVTAADFCIADTATLVLKTRPGQARSVSLVPLIHVAVIALDQIVSNLNEFYTFLKWEPSQREEGLTNCMTMISGPSKTADIELVMVHGAHGPRELLLYVITG